MPLLQFERRVFRHLHWGVLATMLTLSVIGIVAIAGSEKSGETHAAKQAVWLVLGIIGFLFAVALSPPWMRWLAPVAYIAILVSLVGLLLTADRIKGSASWYKVGPLRLQPSEFMKIAVVVLLSDLWARAPMAWRSIPGLLVPITLVGVPVLLIFRQPDLGTAAVFVPVLAVMVWMGGARIRHLILLGLLGLSAAGMLFQHLQPYQRARLFSFAGVGSDEQGRDWNINQAMITLGSGQLWGRLVSEDVGEVDEAAPVDIAYSRTQLDYLPEGHTDFIFSSLGEQFGYVGCAAVLALYALFAAFAVIAAVQARHLQGGLMVAGLLTIVMTHVVLNIGMCLRLLPVTGLPLPFLSYGGSNMLTNFLIGGLICNVAARRSEYETARL